MNVRPKNRALTEAAIAALEDERPMTVRQLFYRLVSAGRLPSTAAPHYARLLRIVTRLREAGEVPRSWIVDHVRTTLKPPSWSGLQSYLEVVERAYRKSFWAGQAQYVEIFVEKDAVAGTIQPVTAAYDVPLRVCRGYASVSFAGEIADTWARIRKPIHAYYLGDFDPSGFDIERDLAAKLQRYSGKSFHWTRLAVRPADFTEFDLLPLQVKDSDTRAARFATEHGGRCAEVDALRPTELRRRVEEAITAHVDFEAWKRLQAVERAERETLRSVIDRLKDKPKLDSVWG